MPKPTKIVTLPSGKQLEIPEQAQTATMEQIYLMGEQVIAKKLIAAGYKPEDSKVKLITVKGKQVFRKVVTPAPV